VKDLAGKTVLLTGASSGLGVYIARRLRREGCRFVLSARRETELTQLAGELGDARVIPADLSRRGEAERLVEEAGDFDILVANAAVPASGGLTTFTVEQIDRALEVNLRSLIVMTRLALPRMLERRSGHLVLMASLAGQVPAPRNSIYNATKFAVRGFAHALAAELRGTGVGVSVISPTFVSEAGMFAESGARVRVRLVTPQDVADAVVTAIRRNRTEIVVAPIEQRVFGRVISAAPGLLRAVDAGSLPESAIASQQDKR
jgi:short-subunit dehydrogenase